MSEEYQMSERWELQFFLQIFFFFFFFFIKTSQEQNAIIEMMSSLWLLVNYSKGAVRWAWGFTTDATELIPARTDSVREKEENLSAASISAWGEVLKVKEWSSPCHPCTPPALTWCWFYSSNLKNKKGMLRELLCRSGYPYIRHRRDAGSIGLHMGFLSRTLQIWEAAVIHIFEYGFSSFSL